MRRTGKDRRLRRRIIAVFIGTVMIPGLVLAFLGLRYIRQEEQQQEQMLRRSIQVTLTGISRETEDRIRENVVQTFQSLIKRTSIAAGIEPEKIIDFLSENPTVDELFFLDKKQQLLFPRSFRAGSKSTELKKTLSPALLQLLISGEEMEAGGRLNEAIVNYRSGLDLCKSTSEKQPFLIRLARCSLKTGNDDIATYIYNQVLSEDSNYYEGEGMPYQLIAVFQLSKILDDHNSELQAFNILCSQYGNMLNHFQQFEQQQFMYYLDKLHEGIKMHLKWSDPEGQRLYDNLGVQEKNILLEPGRSRILETTIIPVVKAELRLKNDPGKIYFIQTVNAHDSLSITAFMDPGPGNGEVRTIGAQLNYPFLVQSMKESLTSFHIGENLEIVLLSQDIHPEKPGIQGHDYFAEEPLQLFEGTLQGYGLAVVSANDSSIKELTRGGIKFYVALIITITIIITLGVFFILHDISREQELSRMKSDFISNVTHEIKTPITTIRSLAENVNEGWITSGEKQQQYFHLIASESEKLGHLIENTLDFSRIESGNKRYQMELISARELIEKTVQRFRVLTEGAVMDLNVEMDPELPQVPMDRAAMEQVILNLLDNAFKYSSQEKYIKVDVKAGKNSLFISVEDHGIGIDRKEKRKIFDKFYRTDTDAVGRITGSGIGLTLVKEIVEAHGGIIEVESERNKGSVFTVQIPINQKSDGKDITD